MTPAMVFMGLGLLVAQGVPGGLPRGVQGALVAALAELTLVVVLYTDASRINLPLLWREHGLPVRLLLVGLPLTIGFGTATAMFLFPQFSIWQAAVLATLVAPTDASLAHPVVTNSQVPVRIRQTISVESGLNDGICVPVLLVFLCGARVAGHDADGAYWFRFAAFQITLGPVLGVIVGTGGGRLLRAALARGWIDESFVDLAALSLAGVAWSAAEVLGGNGFIAAFCGGLSLGHIAPLVARRLHEFGETEGQLLMLLVFFAVGILSWPELQRNLTWGVAGFVLAGLTILRMLPVAISLLGTGLRPITVAFIGWFGPRGTATVVFALLVLEDSRFPLRHEIFTVALATVIVSVLAHGLSARFLSGWYARQLPPAGSSKTVAEHLPVHEFPFCCLESGASSRTRKVDTT